jgi:hypothetical protein
MFDALPSEPVDEAGDRAIDRHHPPVGLAHGQRAAGALDLGEQIEARPSPRLETIGRSSSPSRPENSENLDAALNRSLTIRTSRDGEDGRPWGYNPR